MVCGTSECVMRRRVSDRGVGELVAAALVIVSVVIIVLAIVFIYFRGVMSLTNLYSKVSRVVNYYTSRIYIFNISCIGTECFINMTIPTSLISNLVGVSCIYITNNSKILIPKKYCYINYQNINNISIAVNSTYLTYPGYLSINLLTRSGVIYTTYVRFSYPQISILTLPGVSNNLTGIMLLQLIMYNNSSGWLCFNASLVLYNITGDITPSRYVIRINTTCIEGGEIFSRTWNIYYNCTNPTCIVNCTLTMYINGLIEYVRNMTVLVVPA